MSSSPMTEATSALWRSKQRTTSGGVRVTNQVEQVASKVRAEDDPYRVGYEEGIKFARERFENMWKLDQESDSDYLYCKISREVWRKANAIWQREQSSPNTFMCPEGILFWLTCKGIKVKTGGL
jgi:hypothetical protein